MDDQLQWIAFYKDGSVLRQVEPDGEKRAYADIDRSELVEFGLFLDTLCVFSAKFNDDGNKLIWRRRVQQVAGEGVFILHVVGKKGRYVAIIEQNGSAHMYDNFDERDAILAFPQLVAGEE